MNFGFHTLGCKVNQFETQALEQLVLQAGHNIKKENADVFILNTCTVTSISDKKNLRALTKIKKDNPNAVIAVCGCFAQSNPEKLESLDFVDVICGTTDREKIIELCISASKNKQKINAVDDNKTKRDFEILPSGILNNRTRALLKVQDGCDNFCSYCIIPFARGRVRSMPIDFAVSEALKLEALGVNEIIITGIEISSYGKDFQDKTSLIELIEKICNATKSVRIRLGSLEPRTITENFCKKLSVIENLNPHFHLSMQSGCDEILEKMNRKYKTSDFLNSVNLLRKYFKSPSITTDFIVGFPSESEENFNESLNFIKKCNFSGMHVFPYSVREGTKAATMEGQLSQKTKLSRAETAKKLAISMENEFLSKHIGETMTILAEHKDKDGFWLGHSQKHFIVKFPCDKFCKNEFLSVKILKIGENCLYGEILA